jgi:hemerythrin superfamily protein
MDAVDLVLSDHRNVEALFREFAKADEAERQPFAKMIIRELSIHAAIEETVLYPAVREDVPEGDPLVEHSLDEHHDIKEALARVDDIIDKAHTKEFAAKMSRLQEVVDHHVGEEEEKILPAIREALTKTRLNEIGTAMNKKKDVAPTHPHPSAPDEGIAADITGMAAGVIDRARDAARDSR